jgi:hypothetical protein
VRGAGFGCFAAIFLCGCASTIPHDKTLDLASTTDTLLTRQIGYNLSNFLDSEFAFPAQIVVNSGTATTADTLTPTLTAPIAKQVTNTGQLVATAGATTANAAQLDATALSLQGQDT